MGKFVGGEANPVGNVAAVQQQMAAATAQTDPIASHRAWLTYLALHQGAQAKCVAGNGSEGPRIE